MLVCLVDCLLVLFSYVASLCVSCVLRWHIWPFISECVSACLPCLYMNVYSRVCMFVCGNV